MLWFLNSTVKIQWREMFPEMWGAGWGKWGIIQVNRAGSISLSGELEFLSIEDWNVVMLHTGFWETHLPGFFPAADVLGISAAFSLLALYFSLEFKFPLMASVQLPGSWYMPSLCIHPHNSFSLPLDIYFNCPLSFTDLLFMGTEMPKEFLGITIPQKIPCLTTY